MSWVVFSINNSDMSNINYSLFKDYLTFTDVSSDVIYYLQSYTGLGFAAGSVASGTPYGIIYNPGDIINYNTFSATFIIDEDWKVFETIQNMAIKNAPVDGSAYEPSLTDIDLHLMNNTYQREVGYIRMYGGYVQEIMNVEQAYNTEDNTVTKTMTAIIKYQYHQFFRAENDG